jgi:hypothetical protein
MAALQGDKDGNGIPDWKDLLNQMMSTTTKEIASKAVIDEKTKAALDDPNNITASFAKNLYVASAYSKQKGNLTKAQTEELASSIVASENSKIVVTIYGLSDLHISTTETDDAKKEYGNALGKLYLRALKEKIDASDLAIIKSYSINKDKSVLASLVVKKNNLETVITSIVALPVPASAAPYHLVMINRLSQYKSIIENLSKMDTDPVRATIAFNSYVPIIKAVYSSFAVIQNYFSVENITFSKSEPGFAITSGYTN